MISRGKPRVADIRSLPAPTGGLDDHAALSNMDSSFAIDMLNFYPAATALESRPGYQQWRLGLVGVIETLMVYNRTDGTHTLFACSDSGIFDATTQGTGGASVKTITEGRLNYVSFANVAIQYLVACNGVDPAFLYNGTTFTDFTQVVTPTNPGEISGVNPNLFVNVHHHKHRLWFVEKNSMTSWYLPVDAVGGAATPFYLGGVFTRGGYLVNIATWSMDSGSGMDDLLIFQSSEGEIALYQGNDPNVATDWSLVGVYYIGQPLNSRTFDDMGGDLLFLTTFGVVPSSKVVGGMISENSSSTLSYRISRTLNTTLQARNFQPDWQILNVPAQQSLFINFPMTDTLPAVQYVMNTLTGAWTRYDLQAKCLALVGSDLYFGVPGGGVMRFGHARRDGESASGIGVPITLGFMQAFSDFGGPGVLKTFGMVRPIFNAVSPPSYITLLNVDYTPGRLSDVLVPPSINAAVSSIWNTAVWDSAIWDLGMTVYADWVGVDGIGYNASLVVKASVVAETVYNSAQISMQMGQGL